MVFCNYAFGILDVKSQVDVVYTDFSKAFDTLDHDLLLTKLHNLNCEFIPLDWIASYLQNRTQYVKIANSCSYSYVASSGVPQGGHLGPLLFIIFINDVVSCFRFCKCLLFADDMKIFAEIKTNVDTERFQDDLINFCNWTVHNKLPLNVSKCKVLTFCKSRSPSVETPYVLFDIILDRVTDIRDLGVIFSSDLSFNKHLDYVIGKAFSMLGLIKRHCKDFQDPYTLKTLYVTYVRSVLEYASIIWKPFYKCHSDRLESVQKQFLIYALRRIPSTNVNSFIREPYEDRLALLNMNSLSHRRDVACAVFARDIVCSRVDCPDLLLNFNLIVPRRVLRPRPGLFQLPFCRTNFSSFEPVFNVLNAFNTFYDKFDFTISRKLFKNRLFSD